MISLAYLIVLHCKKATYHGAVHGDSSKEVDVDICFEPQRPLNRLLCNPSSPIFCPIRLAQSRSSIPRKSSLAWIFPRVSDVS